MQDKVVVKTRDFNDRDYLMFFLREYLSPRRGTWVWEYLEGSCVFTIDVESGYTSKILCVIDDNTAIEEFCLNDKMISFENWR